ncbi:uncharacterized protein TNCV_1117521 [Trichonephila clavipes]|nr:uncharacterized protein TNCV_1117521 [Trichonephila clavipes]
MIKVDQVLELALTEGAQIIALQETKLKTFISLKIMGYNIFRLDRQNRFGGGLAFLIKNINYHCININRKTTDGYNLEILGIRIIWRGKPLNIFNMYHPHDLKILPTDLQDSFTVGTICLEQSNTILSEEGNLAINDEPAADLLGLHYQKISRLNFSVEDRNIKIRANRIAYGCRSDAHRGTFIFSRDFRMNELEAVIGDSCLNKSPGPNGIHAQMIDHLGLRGKKAVIFAHHELFLEKGPASSGLEESDRHFY